MGVKECFDGVVVRVADWVFDRIPVDLVELCFQFDDRVGYVGIGRRRPAEENDRVGDLQHFVVLRFLVLVNGRDRDPDASETPINAPNIVSSMSASFRFFAELLPITASVIYHSSTDFSIQKRRFAWEQRELRYWAERYDNLRIPIAANLRIPGTTPYYGANGIQDYVSGYTHDGEFILVAEDGANDLKNYPVQYVCGKIWVNNHAHVLQARDNIASNKFLKYAISQTDIEPFLVGGGRAKLNAETMMHIEIFASPKLEEQEKIGTFFRALDDLIALHQRE